MKFKESVIRHMTRLSLEYGAINLSQGFPNEPPVFDVAWAAAAAIIGGNSKQVEVINNATCGTSQGATESISLKKAMSTLQGTKDMYNQYSIPFGTTSLRKKIADYYQRLYKLQLCHEKEITVTLGATEGICVALRSIKEHFAGKEVGVALLEPFHEMYHNQASLFNLPCSFFALKQNKQDEWYFDMQKFEEILKKNDQQNRRTVFILNSPHNPTGKVFTKRELTEICKLCNEYNAFIITDEIYEHMIFEGEEHQMLYGWNDIRDRVLCVNSVSKTGSATGWRVGWIIAKQEMTDIIRAVHDTMAMQAPTAFQVASEALLSIDDYSYIKERLLPKRETLLSSLREAGFHVCVPHGAYYCFANYQNVPLIGDLSAPKAAEYLTRVIGVACVPGTAFYGRTQEELKNEKKCEEENKEVRTDKYLRFAFCRTMSDLEEATKRLKILSIKEGKNNRKHTDLPDGYFKTFRQQNST